MCHRCCVSKQAVKRNVSRDPDSLSSAVLLTLTYGIQVSSDDDKCLEIAARFFSFMKQAIRPSLLDVSLICRFTRSHHRSALMKVTPSVALVPRWFPGAWHVQFIEGLTFYRLGVGSLMTQGLLRFFACGSRDGGLPRVPCPGKGGKRDRCPLSVCSLYILLRPTVLRHHL